MKITETVLKGCYIFEPHVIEDERGVFFESFKKNELENALGHTIDFVQDNQSISKKGVLRGLHFQKGKAAQAKLIRVIDGEVLDVVVDMRTDSPTYSEHFKINLSGWNKKILFIPKGMAHGFLALSDRVVLAYKCDNYYHPEAESGIVYNDKSLSIDWEFPDKDLILSDKDLKLPKFSEL
ncbi:dTDP-4-dehydrorhamnose 3,5-epimerase [Costertonia aggregata]|uniref:dTDP-4-dehydrorhamnose 3,5-epimerase n=1 Tax=Costertonia aggregata TaxID=343403 RepID=A0A7H9AP60_9FLAO|nr:dTDP-4-dehydrorhamnose 3,5-epimerase [Costertonia aggregata]QLG45251.1 dTDP-4-dehydrorhamnose 3,5-epimerase [Costertonia aggregata]